MALYRKYRPASFAEVVGQEHVTEPLSVALSSGRINHAYLFSGPRGCGKTSSARILARSLNCVEGPTATPCGECDSCVALAPGGTGTLDVTELDAASHGGVDDTRDLRERAFFAPASSRYRVLIIDEAHMVTNAGFNALLKIVEEPPEHLIFIFATTEPEKVLPTIRSRTHHYPFRLLTPSSMRGLVERISEQEGVRVEPTVFPLVIRAGGGSPRDTLSVLDQLMAGAGEDGITYSRAVSLLGATEVALIDDTVDALAAGDGATLFRTVDKVIEAGLDPRRFAADLLQRLRDLIMVQSVPQAIERGLVDAPVEQADTMRRQAENIGPATLARCADMVHEGMGSMRGATSPRLLLEILCAKLLLPSADDSMIALVQRVEALESGTAQAATAPAGGARVRDGGPSGVGGASPDDDEGRSGTGGAPGTQPPAQAEGRPKFVRRSQAQPAEPAARQESQGDAATQQPPSPAPAPQEAAPQQPAPARQEAAPQQPAPQQPAPHSTAPHPTSPAARPVQATPDGSAVPAESVAQQLAENQRSNAGPSASAPDPAPRDAAPGPSPAVSADVTAAPATPSRAAPAEPVESRPSAARPGPLEPTRAPASESTPMPDSAPDSAPAAEPIADPWREPGAAQDQSQDRAQGRGQDHPQPATGARPGPAEEPGREPEPAAAPTAAAPTAAAAPAAAAAPGMEAEDIRRAWPAIRDAVRRRTRTVEVMLAGATVAGVDGRVIHLVHDYAPLAKRLSQPHNATAITDSVTEVVGGDWTIRCTSGGAAAAAADGAPAPAPARGAAPAPADAPGSAQQPEPQGWQRRLRGGDGGQGAGDGRSGAVGAPGGGYDDIPPPPEEPEPEAGEPDGPPPPPVSEEEMVDEARSGPQNIDHRTGEDIALQLLKEHLGARPLER
ncbi:DNA polymerase III subunit gamma/tau [Dietzia natronolimnaea]|uniref:DNA polymerase III subunit gamma/tau n=3 Tax=Dietzia TaxID=37914 RepID=A0A2A2WTZ3_9ACTN|nr:DNA polymerase III subunit gamma and tau [Dietzia natronolimnaea]PAY24699.1 DNA polymerase III subunit gamma/tau [Dietzia natronolimnaea]